MAIICFDDPEPLNTFVEVGRNLKIRTSTGWSRIGTIAPILHQRSSRMIPMQITYYKLSDSMYFAQCADRLSQICTLYANAPATLSAAALRVSDRWEFLCTTSCHTS